ncbi:ankyrin repeat and SAM domain-containing protein 6-like [Branchiostoma floridae]|uniref:Ankyrin repeat and SAM domain-containing protein 6-like n=1 Tax=Branchiostoma floridae TaxID=7739 RepID=A0A9J7MSZ3_BRAFL|nr:ankyrin repeat and SAM domain-containing protein 6-like [Branchiostoma floridae]
MDQSPASVQGLLRACEQGDLAAVQALLDQGVPVDVADDEDATPLQTAAAYGQDSVVRLLLMRGAALEKPNHHGWTPLLQGARNGHLSAVELLLQNKANLNHRSKLGATALTLAARGGHANVIHMLLEAGADISEAENQWGITPLMVGAMYGHDSVVRLLSPIDPGGLQPPHTPDMTAWNALMLATWNGHLSTMQLLVENGYDPNRTNILDQTPLELAILRGNKAKDIRGYLEKRTRRKPRLVTDEETKPDIIESAKTGNIKRIKELLLEDSSLRDASCTQEGGATPLMFAAMHGHMAVVQLLVEKGADINKQDNISGWTALMQAVYYGKKAVAKYLITAGADVNIQAMNGCTAFDMASLIDDIDTELVRLLAAKAMKVNKPQKGRSSAWITPSTSSSNSKAALNGGNISSNTEENVRGLRSWWNRMSNRFRNLKITRTLRGINKLTPFNDEEDINDMTLRSPQQQESANIQEQPKRTITSAFNSIGDSGMGSSSLYTMNLNSGPASKLPNDMLLPVIPPFLPPPTFELNNTDRPRMMYGSRTSLSGSNGSSSNKTLLRPSRFLATSGSTHTSPNNSSHFHTHSPTSSGGASTVSGIFPPSRRNVLTGFGGGSLAPIPGQVSYPDTGFLPHITSPNKRNTARSPAQSINIPSGSSPNHAVESLPPINPHSSSRFLSPPISPSSSFSASTIHSSDSSENGKFLTPPMSPSFSFSSTSTLRRGSGDSGLFLTPPMTPLYSPSPTPSDQYLTPPHSPMFSSTSTLRGDDAHSPDYYTPPHSPQVHVIHYYPDRQWYSQMPASQPQWTDLPGAVPTSSPTIQHPQPPLRSLSHVTLPAISAAQMLLTRQESREGQICSTCSQVIPSPEMSRRASSVSVVSSVVSSPSGVFYTSSPGSSPESSMQHGSDEGTPRPQRRGLYPVSRPSYSQGGLYYPEPQPGPSATDVRVCAEQNKETMVPRRSSQTKSMYLSPEMAPVTSTTATIHPVVMSNMKTSASSSSLSGSSSKTKRPASGGTSRSSTLTPSPSPTRKGSGDEKRHSLGIGKVQPPRGSSSATSSEEVIFDTVSLERYRAIFEEQEVDMEAFLTLTDDDLRELGISSERPRRQILSAIGELNSEKGRERQFYRETLNNFQPAIGTGMGGPGSLVNWNMSQQPVQAGRKA